MGLRLQQGELGDNNRNSILLKVSTTESHVFCSLTHGAARQEAKAWQCTVSQLVRMPCNTSRYKQDEERLQLNGFAPLVDILTSTALETQLLNGLNHS